MHRVTFFKAIKKQSKYKNVPRDYQGNQYHSIKEAKYARDLDIRKRVCEVVSWERQVRIDLHAHGKHICNYFIDFVVHLPSGEKQYVEVKGFETEVWRLKWKLFEAQLAEEEPDALLLIVR